MQLLVLILLLSSISTLLAVNLEYPIYSFRRKSPWARQYNTKEFECKKTCDVSQVHISDFTVDQLKCVRVCASKKCYDEIYAWNELEPGEVDVRVSSFKGCAAEEMRLKAHRMEIRDLFVMRQFDASELKITMRQKSIPKGISHLILNILSDFTVDQLKCVGVCASKKCYDEIYAWNELEPGEVDVRVSSFKGCAAEEMRLKAHSEL